MTTPLAAIVNIIIKRNLKVYIELINSCAEL